MTKICSIILLNQKIPIKIIEEPFCIKCMNPVEERGDQCLDCKNPPSIVENWYFNKLVSIGRYITLRDKHDHKIPYNLLSRMILSIKKSKLISKKKKNTLGVFFADGLMQIIQRKPFLIENVEYLLIPPKNDPEEINQCEYFLNPLKQKLRDNGFKIEDISNELKKTRVTEKNKNLGKEERFINVKNSHELIKKNLYGKKVLILDDVCTSLATIWDISRALKDKNAGEINVLSLGRTLHPEITSSIEKFPDEFNFGKFLMYFSNLDNILDLNKINKVKLKDLIVNEDKIYCEVKDKSYKINIDFKSRTLTHNCGDFQNRCIRNKIFCKHITKLFFQIKQDIDESLAQEKLNDIYVNLLNWNFSILS